MGHGIFMSQACQQDKIRENVVFYSINHFLGDTFRYQVKLGFVVKVDDLLVSGSDANPRVQGLTVNPLLLC